MGISKENLGAAVEEIKLSGDGSYSSKADLGILSDKVDNISIAQKLVNTRGIVNLLTEEVSMVCNVAATVGTSVGSYINRKITLAKPINDYDYIRFQIGVKTSERHYSGEMIDFPVSNIVYNNSETPNLQNNSYLRLQLSFESVLAGAYGGALLFIAGWFMSPTEFFINRTYIPLTGVIFNTMTINLIQGIKIDNLTIDPVEYVNTAQGIEDTPVGHILSMMGKTAPNHYLVCDGMTYNITTYPYLAQYIKDQFGSFNFFGGDGINTFSVPDLRNEFLRGYHANKIEKLSGDIGVHQDGTSHVDFKLDRNNQIYMSGDYKPNPSLFARNVDKVITSTNTSGWNSTTGSTSFQGNGNSLYQSRPTNTAVLYCIKYEPTYFMSIQGMIETIPLWEGRTGTNTTTTENNNITLSDSIVNYDEIFITTEHLVSQNSNAYFKYNQVPSLELKKLIDLKQSGIRIPFDYSILDNVTFTMIDPINSTYTKLNIFQTKSYITKITGIKYKTFQNNIEGGA